MQPCFLGKTSIDNTMPEPLVSIIIPCYNMADMLAETIESVENVYDKDKHEVIIIDDGSTDSRTIEILDAVTRHQVIRKQNQGLARARNTGISRARGKYLIFLDSDNLLTDGYLTHGVQILNNHPEIDIVYGESEIFGEAGGLWFTKSFDLQTLMCYNYIDACSMVRKNIFDDLGGFDDKMPVQGMEDWEMWLRAAFNGKKFYYMEGIVIQKYRVRAGSMIRKVDKKKRDAVFAYMQQKHPTFLNYDGISDFYFEKFNKGTLGWTTKLFIKKYFPLLHRRLIEKGKFSRYL